MTRKNFPLDNDIYSVYMIFIKKKYRAIYYYWFEGGAMCVKL